MDKIEVVKADLIKILKDNRDKHRQVFLDAQEGYKKTIIEELEKRLEEARNGKVVDMRVHFLAPQDQTKDYDRVIGMLEMDMKETASLDELQYQNYVMDDWSWKGQFLASNSMYLSKTGKY